MDASLLALAKSIHFTKSSLSFFLVLQAKRARHANDHARDWRREMGEARKKRHPFVISGCRPRFSRLAASPLARARVHSPHYIWRKSETARSLYNNNREFKIRRLRTTTTDKHTTAHDQNHVTVHFSRVVLRLRWVVELFRVVATTENILLVFCRPVTQESHLFVKKFSIHLL